MEIINKIFFEDAKNGLRSFPDSCVDCCVTSPPYFGLRDYGVPGQLGQEKTVEEFLSNLRNIFMEVDRVLKPTGTIFVNLGDTFNGDKKGNTETNKNKKVTTQSFKKEKEANIQNKSLLMIPERFAIMMMNFGWCLRNQVIWHKPNQMPESVTDRFTVDFEKIFFFTKQPTGYYFKQQKLPSISKDAIVRDRITSRQNKVPGRSLMTGLAVNNYDEVNMRAVWSINTKPFKDAHFATYPEALVERMLTSGCPTGGLVLDPFMGAGTTAIVAKKLGMNYTGFELNEEYKPIQEKRLFKEFGMFL